MIRVLVEAVKNTNNVMVNSNPLKKYLLTSVIAVLSMLSSGELYSQLLVNEEIEIEKMMKQYKENNFDTPMVRAWRIQIITSNDRSVMDEAIDDFIKLYPDIEYKWQHNPPYYQVRIGAYEKKENLEAFLLKLKKDFPSAIPVQDDINKSEIIKNNE